MEKIIVLGYGVLGVFLFNLSLICFIGSIANISFFPYLIDDHPRGDLFSAFLINLLLIAIFGLQHSVMARPQFKRWLTKFIPAELERTTYVICASLLLFFLCAFWYPIPEIIWDIQHPLGEQVLWGLFGFGWLLGMFSSGLIDFFDLMGIRQVYSYVRKIPYIPPRFRVISIYHYIRHPVMLGTLIGLWATPFMTLGHLLLAGGFTIYIFIGIHWSEPRIASYPPPAGAKLRFAEQARADFGICPRRPEQFAFHRTPAFP